MLTQISRIRNKSNLSSAAQHRGKSRKNNNPDLLSRNLNIQAKLKIGQPGDKYEQEADRVAEQVMKMQESQDVPGLQKQSDGWGKQPMVSGPSARLPDQPKEETFEEADSKPRGREKISAPSTWGWGSPETNNLYHECTIAPMSRDRFIKYEATLPKPVKRRTGIPIRGPKYPFGATWPDVANAVPPKIDAEPVQEDGETRFRIKPTHAEMSPIKSAYTKKGEFKEGEILWYMPSIDPYVPKVCPKINGKRVPLFWEITEGGAEKIKEGEEEHCGDIRTAFEDTLETFASLINREAAAERRFREKKALIDFTKKRLQDIPLDSVAMLNKYGQEIEKTRKRDTNGWHEGITNRILKPQENDCKGYLGTFNEKSFPNVGTGKEV